MRCDGRGNTKDYGALFPLWPLTKKTKTKGKTKLNGGILILNKSCSETIVKVFVMITIIENDYNDNSK